MTPTDLQLEVEKATLIIPISVCYYLELRSAVILIEDVII